MKLVEEAKKDVDSYSKAGPISFADIIQYTGLTCLAILFLISTPASVAIQYEILCQTTAYIAMDDYFLAGRILWHENIHVITLVFTRFSPTNILIPVDHDGPSCLNKQDT